MPRARVAIFALRPAPARHEVDDLVAATCAAAFNSRTLVMCNPFPAEGLPEPVARGSGDRRATLKRGERS